MRSPTLIVPSSNPKRRSTVRELVSIDQSVAAPSALVVRTLKIVCGLRHATSVTAPSISVTTAEVEAADEAMVRERVARETERSEREQRAQHGAGTDRVTHGAP